MGITLQRKDHHHEAECSGLYMQFLLRVHGNLRIALRFHGEVSGADISDMRFVNLLNRVEAIP